MCVFLSFFLALGSGSFLSDCAAVVGASVRGKGRLQVKSVFIYFETSLTRLNLIAKLLEFETSDAQWS